MSESSPTGGPFLMFGLGTPALEESSADTFGIDVEHVMQVLEAEVVVNVPLAPAVVEGVINHHGRILTVVDPAPLLGFEPQPQPVAQVVVLRRPGGIGGHVGLKVVRTQEIVAANRLQRAELGTEAILRAPTAANEILTDCVVKWESRLVQILSYDVLLSELGRRFELPTTVQPTSTGIQGASP